MAPGPLQQGEGFVASAGRQSVFIRGRFRARIVKAKALPIVPGASIQSCTVAPGRSLAFWKSAVASRSDSFATKGQPLPRQCASKVAPAGARATRSRRTLVYVLW